MKPIVLKINYNKWHPFLIILRIVNHVLKTTFTTITIPYNETVYSLVNVKPHGHLYEHEKNHIEQIRQECKILSEKIGIVWGYRLGWLVFLIKYVAMFLTYFKYSLIPYEVQAYQDESCDCTEEEIELSKKKK